MQLCYTCGLRPRRHWRDSMCRECRNEYVRLWKARKNHGPKMDGYKPRTGIPPLEAPAKVQVRATPTAAELKAAAQAAARNTYR